MRKYRRSPVGVMNGNWRGGDYYRYRLAVEADARRELEEKVKYEKRRLRVLILRTCRMIANRLNEDDYRAWWESTPDDDNGFYIAAVQKLAELRLAEVMNDPGASAVEQSNAIDRWMTDCWDRIPEVTL